MPEELQRVITDASRGGDVGGLSPPRVTSISIDVAQAWGERKRRRWGAVERQDELSMNY